MKVVLRMKAQEWIKVYKGKSEKVKAQLEWWGAKVARQYQGRG